MPFSSDAADDDAAKKAEAEDEKQYASLIASVLTIQWNVQKTNLVQVKRLLGSLEHLEPIYALAHSLSSHTHHCFT